jgi:hypothetical protein
MLRTVTIALFGLAIGVAVVLVFRPKDGAAQPQTNPTGVVAPAGQVPPGSQLKLRDPNCLDCTFPNQ